MTTADIAAAHGAPLDEPAEKGLKAGALGLVSSIVIGVASTAPAYSLAATLGFVVAAIGLQTPVIALLAFVPMLFVSIGYSELNKADPDCGTTFTWATRAFGPKTGWAGGWGIIAADVLVMASLAQITGQYIFLEVDANGIGGDATSGWVLLVGVLFIVAMTYICYRGIEVSARVQRALLSIELTMLLVLAIVALVKVGVGDAPKGHLVPHASWFNPFHVSSFATFVGGLLLFLFIYWGWDTSGSVNEETADRRRNPGRGMVIATVILLITYALVTTAVQAFAGIGSTGIGLANPSNSGDVLSVLGHAVFGSSWVGGFFTHLLILMVLSSAAASTQTTIMPTARTTLSMAVYKAIPSAFGRIHRRYLTPTVSTLAMGAVSIVLYVVLNYAAGAHVIADSVTALGIMIAFYYGLTGFSCTWYYRKTLWRTPRDLLLQGVLPTLGGLILFFAMAWSFWQDWDVNSGAFAAYTSWKIPFSPHWRIGGTFVIAFVTTLIGLILFLWWRMVGPAFFRGQTLTRGTPTLVPEAAALPVVPAPLEPGQRAVGPADLGGPPP